VGGEPVTATPSPRSVDSVREAIEGEHCSAALIEGVEPRLSGAFGQAGLSLQSVSWIGAVGEQPVAVWDRVGGRVGKQWPLARSSGHAVLRPSDLECVRSRAVRLWADGDCVGWIVGVDRCS
jgi:hypothetical protein